MLLSISLTVPRTAIVSRVYDFAFRWISVKFFRLFRFIAFKRVALLTELASTDRGRSGRYVYIFSDLRRPARKIREIGIFWNIFFP